MSLTPTILAHRLEAAARKLSAADADLAEACDEAAAFFREEFDVPPHGTHAPEVANEDGMGGGRQ